MENITPQNTTKTQQKLELMSMFTEIMEGSGIQMAISEVDKIYYPLEGQDQLLGVERNVSPEWIGFTSRHPKYVAQKAAKIAYEHGEAYGIPAENLSEFVVLAFVSALIHDLGYSHVLKGDSQLDNISRMLGQKVLQACEYSDKEIIDILNYVELHSIDREGIELSDYPPISQIIALADALVHFHVYSEPSSAQKLDYGFYPELMWSWRQHGLFKSFTKFQAWVAKKIERDYHKKLYFIPEIQELATTNYQYLQIIFSERHFSEQFPEASYSIISDYLQQIWDFEPKKNDQDTRDQYENFRKTLVDRLNENQSQIDKKLPAVAYEAFKWFLNIKNPDMQI